MRQGLFPGQEKLVLRYATIGLEAEQEYRGMRRRFLAGLVGGGLAAASGGFALDRWLVSRQPTSSNPEEPHAADRSRLDRYRDLALAPLDRLVGSHLGFLAALEEGGGDSRLWLGFERLALLVLADPEHHPALLRRLRITARTVAPPDGMAWIVARLERGR